MFKLSEVLVLRFKEKRLVPLVGLVELVQLVRFNKYNELDQSNQLNKNMIYLTPEA